MKKLILIVIVFLMGFVIGNYQLECPIYPEIITCEKCPQTFKQELQNCQTMRDNYFDLYSKFQQLDFVMSTTAGAWKFKETQDKDRYVCYDYSKDFEKKWNEAGYSGVMIFGSTPYGRAKGSVEHTWIAVYIEPITGKFIKITDDYREESRDYYIQ